MMQYISHFRYTMMHKIYVFIECAKRGLFIRGIKHDMSKFSREEFCAYANYFFNSDGSRKPDISVNPPDIKLAFDKAWLHHQQYNDHHYQYWIHRSGVNTIVYPMNIDAAMEMVCDWIGAAKANGQFGDDLPLPWYNKNRQKLLLNIDTRYNIERLIGYNEPLHIDDRGA